MEEIRNKVRRIREIDGLTQANLAKEFNVDISTLQRWEAGSMNPVSKHLLMIEERLNKAIRGEKND